jgi:hypothetical protein
MNPSSKGARVACTNLLYNHWRMRAARHHPVDPNDEHFPEFARRHSSIGSAKWRPEIRSMQGRVSAVIAGNPSPGGADWYGVKARNPKRYAKTLTCVIAATASTRAARTLGRGSARNAARHRCALERHDHASGHLVASCRTTSGDELPN